MFTVVPIGTTKDEISFLIFNFSSAVLSVKGIVAALLEEKKAKINVSFINEKNLIGLYLTKYFIISP
tara:strand:+ start:329 stop:529 length:201 start_codon:yes stop_codon:yes gene_type:complete